MGSIGTHCAIHSGRPTDPIRRLRPDVVSQRRFEFSANGMTASDLPACFARLPEVWRDAMPAWTPDCTTDLCRRVQAVSGSKAIAPTDPFRALRCVAPSAARVVVFGQDPYPTSGHADGLAFSAARGRPKSLQRIFEVLAADRPGFVAPSGAWTLDAWAAQGVLLLNTTLTVELGRAGSHLACGWQGFSAQIVHAMCRQASPPVFLLWGSKAQDFFDAAVSKGTDVQVLRTRHPAYDFRRKFMAEGSHFVATAGRVDWWALENGRRQRNLL